MTTNYIFTRNGTVYFIDAVGELDWQSLIHAAHSAMHAGRWMADTNSALEIVIQLDEGTLYKA